MKKKLFEFLNEFDSDNKSDHTIELARGSARIVYKITDNTVMKKAFNKKGIEQNRVEWETYQKLKDSGILAEVYNKDDDYKWIEMELCRRITSKRFENYFGLPFTEFQSCIKYLKQKIRPTKKFVEKPIVYDFLKEKSWFQTIIKMVMEMDMASGDLKRLSSWGENKDDKIVLIDFGLTYKVYQEYYSKDKKKRKEAKARASQTQIEAV